MLCVFIGAFIVDVSESNMHNWNEFIIQSHVLYVLERLLVNNKYVINMFSSKTSWSIFQQIRPEIVTMDNKDDTVRDDGP